MCIQKINYTYLDWVNKVSLKERLMFFLWIRVGLTLARHLLQNFIQIHYMYNLNCSVENKFSSS